MYSPMSSSEIIVGCDHLPVDRHEKHGPLFSTVILFGSVPAQAAYSVAQRIAEEALASGELAVF